jgi:hypothetical protein
MVEMLGLCSSPTSQTDNDIKVVTRTVSLSNLVKLKLANSLKLFTATVQETNILASGDIALHRLIQQLRLMGRFKAVCHMQ